MSIPQSYRYEYGEEFFRHYVHIALRAQAVRRWWKELDADSRSAVPDPTIRAGHRNGFFHIGKWYTVMNEVLELTDMILALYDSDEEPSIFMQLRMDIESRHQNILNSDKDICLIMAIGAHLYTDLAFLLYPLHLHTKIGRLPFQMYRRLSDFARFETPTGQLLYGVSMIDIKRLLQDFAGILGCPENEQILQGIDQDAINHLRAQWETYKWNYNLQDWPVTKLVKDLRYDNLTEKWYEILVEVHTTETRPQDKVKKLQNYGRYELLEDVDDVSVTSN